MGVGLEGCGVAGSGWLGLAWVGGRRCVVAAGRGGGAAGVPRVGAGVCGPPSGFVSGGPPVRQGGYGQWLR
jgi:hypothetical protein